VPVLVYAEKTDSNDFKFSGYLDTSYNYLLRNHEFINGMVDRENDLTQNGFTLQQVTFMMSKLPKQGLGGQLTVMFGRDASWIAPVGIKPYYGSQTLNITAPQAYLQYAIGRHTFVAGLFDTLIGSEDYKSILDTNFSRSILDDYAEPGIIIGARDTYAITDKLSVNAGLNNGWSGVRDRSRPPTFELGTSYELNKIWSFLLQGLSGEQRLVNYSATGYLGRREIINLIVTINATKALTLIVSCDYGVQSKAITSSGAIGRAVWEGIAGYANYQFNDKWRTSVRGEIYDDQNGYMTGLHQNWRELTLTVGYVPIKHVELRAETRHDFSNQNVFMNTDGPGLNKNQQSYAIEALYILR
jgi:hypothetical protein